MRIMPGGALETDQESRSIFVGRKLDDHRGAFLLEYPMDKGSVTDNGWDAMEALWQVGIPIVGKTFFCCLTDLVFSWSGFLSSMYTRSSVSTLSKKSILFL